MKPRHAFEGSPATAARVRIDFAYSQSLAYREAMELCRGIPSFTSTGEGNDVVHSIDVPITDIAVLMRLSELVGGWKSFRITIDGGEARRDDLIRLGGACYGKRQASEDPEQYCFGANRLEYNFWGCRRLDMPIDEAGHGWMAYGSLDAQSVWHFDKFRISRALESAMAGCRLCPVFDRARVQKTLDGLPETVDPRRDKHWRYRGGPRTQEGGGPRNAGIAPVAARIAEYVVDGFRPQWDFTRDWRDSKTEIYLGAVDRWSPSEAPDGDRTSVVIDREEVVKSRAGAARPQPGRPETEPPARWPRVAAVALCMFALCMLGLVRGVAGLTRAPGPDTARAMLACDTIASRAIAYPKAVLHRVSSRLNNRCKPWHYSVLLCPGASLSLLTTHTEPGTLSGTRPRNPDYETGYARPLQNPEMLTDTRCRNAKPKQRSYKLTDGKGLYLEVKPNGVKAWRYRFELVREGERKESVFAIGDYSTAPTGETEQQAKARRAGGGFTLAEAREQRAKARALVRQGINPAHQRQHDRIQREREGATTFEAVATEWLTLKDWEEVTKARRLDMLARVVFPKIGALPVRRITPAHVLDVLDTAAKNNGPTVAAEAKRTMSGVFDLAVSTLRADVDPVYPVRKALPANKTQHKRPLTAEEVGLFLRDLAAYERNFQTVAGFRLMWLTLCRPSEVMDARWEEFDLEAAIWRIPPERMKKRKEHVVPLPQQAVDLLRTVQGFTGHRAHVFPNRDNRDKPMSEATLRHALAYLGWSGRYSPHATRTTGSTRLNEMGYPADWIERQLAHTEPNAVRRTYNHADYLTDRARMMQAWADYLDGLKNGAEAGAAAVGWSDGLMRLD